MRAVELLKLKVRTENGIDFRTRDGKTSVVSLHRVIITSRLHFKSLIVQRQLFFISYFFSNIIA